MATSRWGEDARFGEHIVTLAGKRLTVPVVDGYSLAVVWDVPDPY